MRALSLPQKLYHILRIASVMCYIGHGVFGIIAKEIWCNYFGVFGIGEKLSYQLMPYVGIADILLGLILLFYPVRAAAGWLVFWGLFTALLRPLSGEPFAEFIERAGNYGAPFVLLMLTGFKNLTTADWLKRIDAPANINAQTHKQVIIALKCFGFLLLLGHGWLNVIEKQGLLNQYKSLGFTNPVLIAHIIGTFELIAAFSLLFKPIRPLILFLFIWKMATELFYPAWGIFEWIERGGSYGVLLALWYATMPKDMLQQSEPKLLGY
ncbi:MAG: hypothetical protein IT249_12685 [Chitinophagaceae bacterium]|nr:hypothetical protein [Chitinophagaceae bacterium]